MGERFHGEKWLDFSQANTSWSSMYTKVTEVKSSMKIVTDYPHLDMTFFRTSSYGKAKMSETKLLP